MRSIIFLTFLFHAVFAAPQFLTLNDGKIGVNFGGYHAEAGLFDALTGRGPHASAGTPWGAGARAGLGGREGGIAYAGAQASPSVGASTVLGGASEAHANGVSHSLIATNEHITPGPETHEDVPSKDNVIQKIKPPKKYTLIKEDPTTENVQHAVASTATPVVENVPNAASSNNVGNSIIIHKNHRHLGHQLRKAQRKQLQILRAQQGGITVEHQQPQPEQQSSAEKNTNIVHSKNIVKTVQTQVNQPEPNYGAYGETRFTYSKRPDILHQALNIPIGILSSLQQTLGGLATAKAGH